MHRNGANKLTDCAHISLIFTPKCVHSKLIKCAWATFLNPINSQKKAEVVKTHCDNYGI